MKNQYQPFQSRKSTFKFGKGIGVEKLIGQIVKSERMANKRGPPNMGPARTVSSRSMLGRYRMRDFLISLYNPHGHA